MLLCKYFWQMNLNIIIINIRISWYKIEWLVIINDRYIRIHVQNVLSDWNTSAWFIERILKRKVTIICMNLKNIWQCSCLILIYNVNIKWYHREIQKGIKLFIIREPKILLGFNKMKYFQSFLFYVIIF
jgi:hypothetical protein